MTRKKLKNTLQFISSGYGLFDCVLGGGYPLGRIVNIVGDKSSGKTLLGIEACANFYKTYKKDSKIWYLEVESAFDKQYAQSLGMPIEAVTFLNEEKENDGTVEFLYEQLEKVLEDESCKQGLFIVDSLDALTDRKELERSMDKGTYGADKPKMLSKLFRKLVRRLEEKQITFIVISQIRDKIGVVFGETKSRSGGKALDFYASQIIWLTELGKIKRTIRGVERVVGVSVRVRIKKNKVGMPFRDCDYQIEFGYGIDNVSSYLKFLVDVKKEDLLNKGFFEKTKLLKSTITRISNKIKKLEEKEFKETSAYIEQVCKKVWDDIENDFKPERKKYDC